MVLKAREAARYEFSSDCQRVIGLEMEFSVILSDNVGRDIGPGVGDEGLAIDSQRPTFAVCDSVSPLLQLRNPFVLHSDHSGRSGSRLTSVGAYCQEAAVSAAFSTAVS